jgi:Rod binding domain-containing protein
MELTPLANSVTPATSANDGFAKPKNATEAAQQFEALLLGQMLRSVHTQEHQEDGTAGTMWDMAAQQFSQVLSKNGGFGLAKLITKGLESK